jgi:[ribosomal protein S5]-alanine N-acetyltransferase
VVGAVSLAPPPVLTTQRLALRRLRVEDAAFLVELLNEPSFLRFIGDRKVRNVDDALRYLENGPFASYERHGFGLWAVEPRAGGEPMGMCGLLKRDWLGDVDIGFAFLPRYWGRGHALEAAAGVMAHARDVYGLERLAAITSPDNVASIAVLEKLGFQLERLARTMPDDDEVKVFVGSTR